MGGIVDTAVNVGSFGLLDAGDLGLSGPAPPDPNLSAQAQMDINRDAMLASAQFNQMTQRGPGYNISYSGDIGDPNRTMTYGLDPGREQLAQLLGQRAVGQAGEFGGPIDYSGVTGIPGYEDFGARAGEVEGTMYDALMSRARPDIERQARMTETNLANRGIPVGGEAWADTMGQQARAEQDVALGAAGQAIGLGRDESNRLFQQQMAAHQAGMGDIGFKEDLGRSNLAMMMNANPYTQAQVMSPTQYQMAPADFMGAEANKYAAESANYQAGLGGLATLGGAAIMSDRRLKRNISHIGQLASGLNVYEFSYIWDNIRHIGVMAQEVLKVIPEAVHTMANGFMAVDYSMVK